MGAARTVASRLLRAVQRLSPASSREWANGMLRELDFIESDWAALFWALGSVIALCRHFGRGWIAWFSRNSRREEEAKMKDIGKKAVGVGSGVVFAGMLVLCAFGLLRLVAFLFPGLGLDHLEWTHWLTVIVIPEAAFVVAAITLWRKRGPVAVGILLWAVVMALHVVIHVASH